MDHWSDPLENQMQMCVNFENNSSKDSACNHYAMSMNKEDKSHRAMVYRYKMLPFNVLFFLLYLNKK